MNENEKKQTLSYEVEKLKVELIRSNLNTALYNALMDKANDMIELLKN